jgi:hypothetical protein
MSEPLIVFYDTEFTDLGMSAELLSIGFVAADTNGELYIELADADRRGSSSFVREVVLPLFGRHNPQILRRAGAAAKIEAWLDGLREGNRERPILLLSDYGGDWMHLLDLFVTVPGEFPWPRQMNLSAQLVQNHLLSGRQNYTFDETQVDYFREHGDQHHALIDARAMKAAWFESRFQ